MKYDDFKSTLKTNYGLTSEKLDIIYNESDSRCWTALIGRDTQNVFVTFHVNRGELRVKNFDIIGNRKQMVEIAIHDVFDILKDLVPAEETE